MRGHGRQMLVAEEEYGAGDRVGGKTRFREVVAGVDLNESCI